MTRSIKYIYFLIFYNTNFVINISSVSVLYSILLVINMYTEAMSIIELSLLGLILILSTFLYNIIYIVNDIIDYQKDIRGNVYKVSLFSQFGINKYIYFITYLFIMLGLIYILFNNKTVYIPILIYICTLILIAIIHSKWKSLKIITLFLERLLRLIVPFFIALYIVPNTLLSIYSQSIALLFPLFVDESYSVYIQSKLKQPIIYRFYVYIIYWIIVIPWLKFDGILLSIVVISYLALNTVYSLLAKNIDLRYLKKKYGDLVYEKKKIILQLGVNILIIIIALGYVANI